MERVTEELLAETRNYLDITWEDAEGEKKLKGILARGIRHIDRIAGSNMDYAEEGKPKELLLEYARYVRSNALDEFDRDYQQELLALQIDEEVARYGTETTEADVQ